MKTQMNKYPNTLFNLTKKIGMLEKITVELEKIKYLYRNEPIFKLLFETKRINQEEKKKIIKNTLIGFEPVVSEFLSILIDKKISKDLINIIDKFLIYQRKKATLMKLKLLHRNN